MRGRFINKQYIILILVLILGVIIMFSVFIFGEREKKTDLKTSQTPPEEIQKQLTEQASITPPSSSFLALGQNQSFTINPGMNIDSSNLLINVTKRSDAKDMSPEEVFFDKKSYSNQIVITLQELIQAYTSYEVSVVNFPDNRLILKNTYLSEIPIESNLEKNDVGLSKFLPYEVENFILSYLPDRNIYYFNFKANLDSSIPIEQQFKNAQNTALDFIVQKGFDINTIKIEWRFR